MATLTVNVFNVTGRCPVCGGSANAKFHGPDDTVRVKHKCGDCGYSWQENAVARPL